MIQLQYYNDNMENGGGLYIKTSEIAAVYAKKIELVYRTVIVLASGKEFMVVNEITEVLDFLSEKARI